MLVDDHSAQILGVPQSEEHSVEYAVCARNRLGSSVTHVSMSVMTQPGMLAYPTNLLQLTPGVPVRLQVGTLEGSRPINFKCDQLLPQGLKLDAKTGAVCGAISLGDPSFLEREEMVVNIYAANTVGSCVFELTICNGPRSAFHQTESNF